jgi:hypothetical protein
LYGDTGKGKVLIPTSYSVVLKSFRPTLIFSRPGKVLAEWHHMTYRSNMEMSNVICFQCRSPVMSVRHAVLCLKLSYIPVEVKNEHDVLVSRGWTEGHDGESVLVMDLDTNESRMYPFSWVKPVVS